MSKNKKFSNLRIRRIYFGVKKMVRLEFESFVSSEIGELKKLNQAKISKFTPLVLSLDLVFSYPL